MRRPFTSDPTFEERMAAAYEAGREAREDGLPPSPSHHARPADIEWRNGWHEASARRRGARGALLQWRILVHAAEDARLQGRAPSELSSGETS